jgi:hypothetical protein
MRSTFEQRELRGIEHTMQSTITFHSLEQSALANGKSSTDATQYAVDTLISIAILNQYSIDKHRILNDLSYAETLTLLKSKTPQLVH